MKAPANATQGEIISVNATVTNTGNASGQTTIDYRFDTTPRGSSSIILDAGNETTVAFIFNTSRVTTGTYTHGIFTSDDNETAEITTKASTDGNTSEDHNDSNTSDGGNDSGSNGSVVTPGPQQGTPPQQLAAFKNTVSLTSRQTTPSSLAGKIRVESAFQTNTSIELVKNTSRNYTLLITVTGDATNVTFFLQRQAVESSQNISNVTMYLDGQKHVFYDESAGPGNSPWLLFEIDHFSTRRVSFTSTTQTPSPIVGDRTPTDTDSDGLCVCV